MICFTIPFKSRKYVQNPYDIDSSNDPCKHLNYVDTINNNNNLFISSSFPNYNNNININDSKEQNKNKTNQINLGNSNYEEFPNDPNNNYFTVEDLCNASPTLKPEIYKDIQRPNYIPSYEENDFNKLIDQNIRALNNLGYKVNVEDEILQRVLEKSKIEKYILIMSINFLICSNRN